MSNIGPTPAEVADELDPASDPTSIELQTMPAATAGGPQEPRSVVEGTQTPAVVLRSALEALARLPVPPSKSQILVALLRGGGERDQRH